LFDEGQEHAFRQALLTPFAEITTTSEAISSKDLQSDSEEDEMGDES
jgi:hypothetical protein